MARQPGTAGRPILSSEHVLFLDYSADLDWHLVYFQHDRTRDSSIRLGECSRPTLVLRDRHLPTCKPCHKRSEVRPLCFNILCTLRRRPSSNRFSIHHFYRFLQLLHPERCSRADRLEHMVGDHKTTRTGLEHHCELACCISLEPSLSIPELRSNSMGYAHWMD